jgi:hypothetical protein
MTRGRRFLVQIDDKGRRFLVQIDDNGQNVSGSD